MSTKLEEFGYVFPYKKIKIPFRERRERVRWPDNKILAAEMYVGAEWWGREYSPDSKVLDIASLSHEEEYNFDVGLWRVLDVLDKYELKITFFCSGSAAQFRPEVLREIKHRGHEVAAHGYYQIRNPIRTGMDLETEREDIVKTTAILESVWGNRPLGWHNPGAGCSERTFELLVEQGYLWNGDLRDDDLPYGIEVKDKILIELPHRTMTTNDMAWWSGRKGITSIVKAQRSPREAVKFFRDTFDCYYETAKREGAQALVFGIHPYLSGYPDRIVAIDKMIAYMKSFPDVWFPTLNTLAQYWKENYVENI